MESFDYNRQIEEVVKSVKYVKASTILNMRSGPGTNYDIINQLPNNAEVKVLLDDDTWFYVESNGLKGYVDSSYLSNEPSKEPVEEKGSYKIVIDAGHGGNDPGASGYGLREKDMVLDIANKTALYLEENFTDVEVILTRSDDVFLELKDRVKIANDLEADYFISLHLNAFNGIVGGFETFIFNGDVSQETIDRQKDIHSYIINEMKITDRRMKSANFHVLRESTMPALLIEYLFIDNEIENDLIRDESYRTFLAETTAEALAHSFDLERSN